MIFLEDIEKLTLENTDYRRVIYTSDYSQLVLMSIPVGEDIELEIHPYVDQFFRIEQGKGELIIGEKQQEKYTFQDRSGIVVPHNTYHRIVNVGRVPLKLYTIYSPPSHSKTKVEHSKIKEESKDKDMHKKYQKLLQLLTISNLRYL